MKRWWPLMLCLCLCVTRPAQADEAAATAPAAQQQQERRSQWEALTEAQRDALRATWRAYKAMPTEMQQKVRERYAFFKQLGPERQAAIREQYAYLSDATQTFMAQRGQIEQVLVNLVLNARQATTAQVEGTGLGLAISRQIMQEHGGDLRAMANPEGGMTFKLTIPVAHTSELPSTPPGDGIVKATIPTTA